MARWLQYHEQFAELKAEGIIETPYIPDDCTHNAHMYYIKCKDIAERTALTDFLRQRGVLAVFHYIPLHSALAGSRFSRFHGEDRYTTRESERLLRLPLYYGLTPEDCQTVIDTVRAFYQ